MNSAMRGLRSPSDKRLGAVPADSPCALDGDVPVQAFLADQAGAPVNVTETVLAEDCPDVFIHVAGLVQPAPAGEVIIRRKLRPYPRRRHGQLVVPESSAKRFQRLCAGIFFAYRKGIAPLSRAAAVFRVGWLPTASLPTALNPRGQHSPHTLGAEVPFRGAGSRLHGSRKDCSQSWC